MAQVQVRSKHVPQESLSLPCRHQGLLAVQHGTKTLERIVVVQCDPAHIVHIHSNSSLQDEILAFTDKESRGWGTVKVTNGTGEESNKNGSGSHSTLGQPMAVCTEGANIFVTQGQISTIKLVMKELLR